MSKTKELFWTFFKIGAFTFGGGYAMVALLQNEFVEEKKWVTKEEFLDMVAIAESTPGPVAVNSATYIGYKMAGTAGAALATLILIWVLFVVACTLFVPLVFDKLYQFATLDFGSVLRSVEEPIARMQEYLHDLFALPDERFSLTDSLIQWFKSIFDYDTINTAFSSIVSLTLSAVIAFFSVSFITFFFLKDDELFLSMLKAPFPERVHGNIERAMSSVSQLLMRYFTGILSESCILMIVISVTMIFFGMRTQDAFFIGLIMGVMNVVPYAGPLIGGVMSVFMGVVTPIEGMTTGHTMFVIAGSLLIIKGFDDFVLQPTLYSERVKAHPLEIFIVILIAGSLAGIVGMLLAIPSYTVLRVFAKVFFSQFRLVQKLTEKI